MKKLGDNLNNKDVFLFHELQGYNLKAKDLKTLERLMQFIEYGRVELK
jgi:hypothetical protein